MSSQSMNTVPSGLARVLNAADQINPVTPQGGLSVAASVLAQANKMPGVAGIAQNTATGNAIEMQQQQAAQQALMNQMLAQQRTQQPPMMAEGGIASLYAGNMDDFAEGGVVGFAEGGVPPEYASGNPDLDNMVRTLQQTQDPDQRAMIGNAIRRLMGRNDQKPTQPTTGRGISSIAQTMAEATAPSNPILAEYQLPNVRSRRELAAERGAELESEGLPTKKMAAEEQGLAELRRQNEAIRAFQEQMLAKKEAALGTPGEQSMNRFMAALRYGGQDLRGGFAQGLENAILAERQGAEARDADRLKMLETGKAEAIEYTRIKSLIEAARRAELEGDITKSEALKEAARQASNKIVSDKLDILKSTVGPAIAASTQLRTQGMPTFANQMVQNYIAQYLKEHPSASYTEAYDAAMGAGKGIQEKIDAAAAKNAETQRTKIAENIRSNILFDKEYRTKATPAEKEKYLQDKIIQAYETAGIALPKGTPSPTAAPVGSATLPPGFKLDTK